MQKRDVIVIGGSRGGVDAVSKIVSGLPQDLPAALLLVLHISADFESDLPSILNRVGPIRAVYAKSGQTVQPGHIYVAPPDYHLLVQADKLLLSHTARENSARPAIDPLFRSAARHFGARTIAVLL